MIAEGIIVKATGGFYYVESNQNIYECKARGIFRKTQNSPLVGDYVDISIPSEGYASIEKIHCRKNQLLRPAIANIDNLFIVSSIVEPNINLYIVDKMISVAVYKGIKPIVIFTKTDLSSCDNYLKIYKNSNIVCYEFSSFDQRGVEDIKLELKGKVNAFTGNSGVGKSTLINSLFPELKLDTNEISEKLGRGKHTTRTVELFNKFDGYIADTPGFSTVDIEHYEIINKNELQYCFPEFRNYLGKCKFNSCLHTVEKGCAILDAINNGNIEKSRHNSYVRMFDEVKDIKDWQLKK